MKILWYLLVPMLLVTTYSVAMWFRNHKPTSLESGVDDFQREMKALSPGAVRAERRRPGRPPGPAPGRRARPPVRRH